MYEDIREILKQVWPEWEIVEKIGEGSFGTVYKVVRQDIVGTSYAAVKVSVIPRDSNEAEALRAEGLTELETSEYYQQAVRDYTKEIQLMASVKGYTNIVAIEDYKVFKPEGRMIWYIFIRMELLTPLLKVVAAGEMSEREIIRLGTDLCSALDICRQNRIIHRDIKPENIFVNSHGDYKLGDFGVARNLEKLTNGLSRKGTPNYMAPEVYKSSLEETDFTAASRVDIYSLGMVLYWLGNGSRLPFLPKDKQIPTPMDRKTAISRRVNGEPLPPPAKVSPALQRIILKACAYEPEERYASAAEMRAELAALAAGTSASGSGPSASPQPPPPPADKPHDHDSVPSAGGGSQKPADPEGTVAVNRSLSDNPPSAGSDTAGTQSPRHKKYLIPLLILIIALGCAGIMLMSHLNEQVNTANTGSGNKTVTVPDDSKNPPTQTKRPTSTPTKTPTKKPTASPTKTPTKKPTASPTKTPTKKPTASPTKTPTKKPTASPTKTPTKKPTASPTQVITEPAVTTGYLDLVWDSRKSLYALTVNGKKLEWDQTMKSAAQFCTESGIKMVHFDSDMNKDAYSSKEIKVFFLDSLAVNNNFFVRKAANSDKLIQIDLQFARETDDPNKLISCAQEVFRKLQKKIGDPTSSIEIYRDGRFTDAGTNDIKTALEKVIQLDTDNCYVWVEFQNVHLYTGKVRWTSTSTNQTGTYYHVSLSLSPY